MFQVSGLRMRCQTFSVCDVFCMINILCMTSYMIGGMDMRIPLLLNFTFLRVVSPLTGRSPVYWCAVLIGVVLAWGNLCTQKLWLPSLVVG